MLLASERTSRGADGPWRALIGGIRRWWPYYATNRTEAAANVAQPHFHITHKGMRRETNQDQTTTRALPGGKTLLLVADGVGGAGGGEVASAETLESIVAQLAAEPLTDPADALRSAVRRANDVVRERATTDERLKTMATTLVAAIIDNGHAWLINVGDSRAYLYHGGSITPLTEDDSWVAEQVRAGALTEEEAARSPYQNVITRGVGVEETINVEKVTRHELASGDVLVLCSDGLYRCVTSEQIAETLALMPVDAAGKKLIDLANAAGGPDNISVALYRQS